MLHLFAIEAAVPTATGEQLVGALIGLCSLMAIFMIGLNIVDKIKKLQKGDQDDQYLTHKEFKEWKIELDQRFEQLTSDGRTWRDELTRIIGKLNDNQHDMHIQLTKLVAYNDAKDALTKHEHDCPARQIHQ